MGRPAVVRPLWHKGTRVSRHGPAGRDGWTWAEELMLEEFDHIAKLSRRLEEVAD